MKKAFVILLILVAGLGFVSPVTAVAKGWEPVKTERPDGRHVASDSDIEIKSARGVIYVNTSKAVNIKIYTILGSQIANDNLGQGYYQFLVPAHGVYIIKAGDLTCKVAV